MPGGRPKNQCFDELGFLLVKEKNKYAALCTVCNKQLSNTAASRLKVQRNICKLKKDGSETITFVIEDSLDHAEGEMGDNFIDFDTSDADNSTAHTYFFNEPLSIPSTSSLPSPTPPSSLNLLTSSSSCSKISSTSSAEHKKRDSRKISNYMDSLSLKEEEEITEALASFIFGCNLPLTIIESVHFKKFIKKIRPAYYEKIPNRKRLSTTILDKMYEKCLSSGKESIGSESALLIDGWKNSSTNTKTVVSMIHNSNGEEAFINAWNLSGETENADKQIIDIAKELYSTKIYAVVSDNANVMVKMGKLANHVVWHSTCNSHTANLLAKDIMDKEINSKVITIMKEFKNTDLEKYIIDKGGHRIKLPCETRWCTYRDCYANLISNLQYIRQYAIDPNAKRIKPCTSKLIFDDEFIESVKDIIKIFDPICNLINVSQQKTCSIADATKLWLELHLPEKFNDKLESRKTMALNVYALTAYYLHPHYDNRKLSEDHLSLEYSFWSTAPIEYPGLSSLSKKLMRLPASTAQIERLFSQWAYVHSPVRNKLTFDRSKKLLNIYYTLKLMDTEIDDDDDEDYIYTE